MRLALGLAVIGVVLGVVAVVGMLNDPTDVGDSAAVASSLGKPNVSSTTTPTAEGFVPSTAVEPLWSPNDVTLLADLEEADVHKPERLIIETLGIDAPVGAYGVDANGQMDVPDNITEVGWYRHGPSPGEPGSAVLAAHVDLTGPGKGLFYDLGELEVDAEVVVLYSDGGSREFRVVARSTYLKTQLPLDSIFSREGDPVLTLVTCGGGFSQSARSYDSNVVVFAVPSDVLDSKTPESS